MTVVDDLVCDGSRNMMKRLTVEQVRVLERIKQDKKSLEWYTTHALDQTLITKLGLPSMAHMDGTLLGSMNFLLRTLS